jgi:putative transcriptional regulator
MSVTHRIGDEWIMDYAAGALSEGAALMVASHLSFLPEARAELAVAEAVGGALLDGLEPDALAPDALDRMLASLDAAEPSEPAAEHLAGSSVLPPALHRWLGRDVDDLDWSFLGPGMRKVKLWRGGNDERLWMLRARPGARIPKHGHRGIELVLVLKGSFTDPTGTFHIGDIEEADDTGAHGLVIGGEDECICLALTQGPIRFYGWIARLMQPFLGL